ncbi:alpha/beta fold hydrolase [Cupriavidus basilensis]|uniref:Alpha/beta hydrolase n=1 Tax=Cupriavidus basilensis TaxID=68895 RepID=A0A7M2HC40_9BURK|nr:alpha/beta hydrolase [Cupriavidus basilensis]QOT82418.1 alpha/beta hydrolase [Cupriavidus basilensis]
MKSYKLIGFGPKKVLLFPGLLGTQDAFNQMLKYADLENFQYAIAEYRGYGGSKNLPGLFNLREVVIDAYKLVEFLGWKDFAIGGHSIGALAAQMVAIAMPQRVGSIVSIAGMSAKGGSRDPDRMALLNAAANSAEHREQMVAGGTAGRYTPGFARTEVAATFDSIDPLAFASYAKDASQTDVSEEAKNLPMPILALVGEHDPACSEQAARATTSEIYRTASVEVIAGAGHYPHCEAPIATLTLIEKFLSTSAR